MRKSLLAAAGGLAATAALGASAFAAPPYTVSVAGSTATGTHAFFASSDSAIAFQVQNGSVTTNMNCAEVNAEGNVYSGTGLNPIATIMGVTRANTPDGFTGTQWKTCTGPFGVALTVVQTNNWSITGTGGATAGNTDVIAGEITGPSGGNLTAHVYATSGGPTGTSCNFKVRGSATGSFAEATQKLNVNETGFTGDLEIYDVIGNCLGTVVAGNAANFTGTFTLGDDNAANTKASITHFFPVYAS